MLLDARLPADSAPSSAVERIAAEAGTAPDPRVADWLRSVPQRIPADEPSRLRSVIAVSATWLFAAPTCDRDGTSIAPWTPTARCSDCPRADENVTDGRDAHLAAIDASGTISAARKPSSTRGARTRSPAFS
jgi:hypothetical protein